MRMAQVPLPPSHDPTGIAVDSKLYVTDLGNDIMRKIDLSTTSNAVTTWIGVGGNNGATDGVGTNARLETPQAWHSQPTAHCCSWRSTPTKCERYPLLPPQQAFLLVRQQVDPQMVLERRLPSILPLASRCPLTVRQSTLQMATTI